MLMALAEPSPLRCEACGSDHLVLAYTAPVYAIVKDGAVARVVVSDEEIASGGELWCRRCGERWHLKSEPDTGGWPAWEVGW
jgi:hypothetical protein